ncbi:unnamed protein product [Schistocephalus solidus]|uniref:LAM_G_DOMAIN domain-containing protein n=1 Tax=Schistocephalus solidus TaxID=70667 RepID=A0A183SQK0_SCHSO|nr:unnamed protein product [Schistocephalus solidus]
MIPEFYGNSYLAFWGIKATSMTDTLFQVVFLPRGQTGLLAYSGYSLDRRGDFFMLALVDGKVLVSFDLGTGPAFLRSSSNVTIGEWHTVEIRRIGRSFTICVDNTPNEVEAFTEGSFIQLTISDHLFLGGHPNPDHLSALIPDADHLSSYKGVLGLTGCIQMVSVNGRILHLIKDAVNATNVGNCDNHSCATQVPVCHPPAECLPQGPSSLFGFFPAATPWATVTTGGLNQVRVSGVVSASTPCMSDSRTSHLPPLEKSYGGGNSNPKLVNVCLGHQHKAEIVASTVLTVLAHSLIACAYSVRCASMTAEFTAMPTTPIIHAQPPQLPFLPPLPPPTTMNDILPASPNFSCPHCARNFNSRIGLDGHL